MGKLTEFNDEKYRKPCAFGTWRLDLDADDQAEVAKAMASHKSAGVVSDWIGANGYDVSTSTVRNHRRGDECQWCSANLP